MRLVCPNCGAQYEVDDRVIPDTGRDVQCSSCGHGWFQRKAGSPEEETPDTDFAPVIDEPEEATPEVAPEPEVEAAPEPAPAVETAADSEPDEIDPDDEIGTAEPDEDLRALEAAALAAAEAIEPPAAPAASDEEDEEEAPDEGAGEITAGKPQQRAPLDSDLREMLQEEAQRELEARAAERGRIESQPDLGLVDAGMAARVAAAVTDSEDDSIAEAEAESAPRKGGYAAPRRDVFPNIEEINSTLDAQGASIAAQQDEEEQAVRRGAFRRGFALVILLAAIAYGIYVFAPVIGAKVPQAMPVLDAYVGAVNTARLVLEGWLQGAISKMESLSGGS